MKRPILIALIGYLIGIIWGLYFKISIAPFVIICIIIVKIVGMHDYAHKNCMGTAHRARQTIIILVLMIIISNSIMIYLNNKYEEIYKTSPNESNYIATVISNKNQKEYKKTYIVKIESIDGNNKYKDIRLILNIPNSYNLELEYGDQIEFKGIYNAPEVQRNYKGFDYSKYLKTIKIYGTVTCSYNKIKVLKTRNVNPIKMITNKISNNIESNIKKMCGEKESALLIGILLGNNANIDEETKENFRNSGIYHILAVSGAHMSYVVLGITYIIDKINISKRKKDILKIIGIIFFMLITSSSVSVMRAGMMGIITICAELFYRKKDTINTICLSMLIILIYNPYCINSISFQLSYGGVIGIIYLNDIYIQILERTKINQKIIKVISVILSAQTIIIPILIINYHTISLVFLFSNILISYLIGIVIILGFICVFLSFISIQISEIVSIPLSFMLKILIHIATFFGSSPLSKIYTITPSILSIILYYSIISLIKTKLIKLKKVLIGLLIITILINSYIRIPIGLKIYFIDVGQGDSTLIITPSNKKILIDGGGTRDSSGTYDVGENILLPYLLNRGIKKLDYIIISHFDSDHVRADY